MFLKNENEFIKSLKLNEKQDNYHISYDKWENVAIFVAEICLSNLNIEILERQNELILFNQNNFFI